MSTIDFAYLNASPEILQKAKAIRLLVLDVDGVLSDGRIYLDNHHNEIKAFNTKDGHGIKVLKENGIEVGIITGRKSALLEKRCTELGITLVIQGREDKFTALQEMLNEYPCDLECIAYMGDDYPDLRVMTKIGLPMCPADAHFVVQQKALWIAPRQGGNGAVRDASDMILLAQNTFLSTLGNYFDNE